MNVTKNVITDLYPLYSENECSADTRALIEEFLGSHPEYAEELRRIASMPLPAASSSGRNLDEAASLRRARRLVRRRAWFMGLAIFFSLTPFSILHTGGKTYWLYAESPRTGLVYGAIGIACWIIYAVLRRNSQAL